MMSGLVSVNATVLVTDAITGTMLPLTWTSPIGYYEIELPPGDYYIHVGLNGLVYDGIVGVYPHEKAALDITLEYRRHEELSVPNVPADASTIPPRLAPKICGSR
jgi:hypothetical protein